MSLRGEINKVSGDIRRSVERMSRTGVTGIDGSVRGTKKILGYVCAINEDGDLAGTVDVQEFNYEPDEYSTQGVGHHKGVLLSAIQDNSLGFQIVPMLYSEVVIVQNPIDQREYVIMYSHARQIRLAAQSLKDANDGKVEIGVTETEGFVETDDGLENDYNELELTKNQTKTTYTASSITDQIGSADDEAGYTEEKTAASKTITVGNTTITIDGGNVSIETSGKVSFSIGSTTVTHEDGTVKIETDSCQIKGSDVKVEGSNVTITGGNLKTQGVSSTDLNGPFNAIKVCPFSGAPHCGSTVSGT